MLDTAALAETASKAGPEIALRRTVRARRSGGRLVPAALGLAVAVGLIAAWTQRDALLAWFAKPEPMESPAALLPEPAFAVSIDGAALIAACRRALIDHSPFMPAWRIERVACTARFADPELTALRPELAGRPVLLARWRLAAGHAEAMHRRLAETHLARWHAAAVADRRAWAAVPLAPVIRVTEAEAPSFLDLRRAVDRVFGTGAARIGYGRGADGAWMVREPWHARVRLDELLDGRRAAPAARARGERDRAGGGEERGLPGGPHRQPRLPAHGDAALHTLPLGRSAGDADDYRRVGPRQRRLRSRGRAGLGRSGRRSGRQSGRRFRRTGRGRLRPLARRPGRRHGRLQRRQQQFRRHERRRWRWGRWRRWLLPDRVGGRAARRGGRRADADRTAPVP